MISAMAPLRNSSAPSENPFEKLRNTSLKDIDFRIAQIRTMNVKDYDQDYINRRMEKYFDGYLWFVTEAPIFGFYRARKNPDETPFKTISELWYPPPQAISRRGRFNPPGTNVLYASDRFDTAIAELRPRTGDGITLLCAIQDKPLQEIKIQHIGTDRLLEASHPSDMVSPRKFEGFKRTLADARIWDKWLKIDDFFADMITELFPSKVEEDKYRITNAIVRPFYQSPEPLAATYPSVAVGRQRLNIMLKPIDADRLFTPASSWRCWMIKLNWAFQIDRGAGGSSYNFEFLAISETIKPNGEIVWNNDIDPHGFSDSLVSMATCLGNNTDIDAYFNP